MEKKETARDCTVTEKKMETLKLLRVESQH